MMNGTICLISAFHIRHEVAPPPPHPGGTEGSTGEGTGGGVTGGGLRRGTGGGVSGGGGGTGTHRRRCTHKAVHTQGSAHTRRSVATAGVSCYLRDVRGLVGRGWEGVWGGYRGQGGYGGGVGGNFVPTFLHLKHAAVSGVKECEVGQSTPIDGQPLEDVTLAQGTQSKQHVSGEYQLSRRTAQSATISILLHLCCNYSPASRIPPP